MKLFLNEKRKNLYVTSEQYADSSTCIQ